LTNLRAIFLGDITYEENEISWIEQSDVSPLLRAYPALEVSRVRGGNSLEFSKIKNRSAVLPFPIGKQLFVQGCAPILPVAATSATFILSDSTYIAYLAMACLSGFQKTWGSPLPA
jgi:hypothetical protein